MDNRSSDNPLMLDNGWVLAAHWKRVFAFFLDFVLVTLIAMLIVFQFWLPGNYPEAWSTFMERVESLQSSGESLRGMELSGEEQDMFIYGELMTLLVFWLYFLAGEVFLKGSSIGKKVFGLRAVSIYRYSYLNFWESMVRAFTKTVSLLVLFPFLQVSYLLAFFTRKRQAGHDFICRSCVVEDIPVEHLQNEATKS